MTPSALSQVIGKSIPTIINWCKSGKIKAQQKKGYGRGGHSWDIPQSEATRIAAELAGKPPTNQKEKERIAQESQSSQAVNEPELPENFDELINARKLSRPEAERLIKIEDAIKRRRENLLSDKELIEVAIVSQNFREFVFGLVQALDELVDNWTIRYHWTAENSREVRVDVQMALQKFERKLKNVANEKR